MEAETLVASGLLELKWMVTYGCWYSGKPRNWKLLDEPAKSAVVDQASPPLVLVLESLALFGADCDTLVVHLCPHFQPLQLFPYQQRVEPGAPPVLPSRDSVHLTPGGK